MVERLTSCAIWVHLGSSIILTTLSRRLWTSKPQWPQSKTGMLLDHYCAVNVDGSDHQTTLKLTPAQFGFAWMTLNMTTAKHPTSMTTRIIPGEKRSPFASQSKAPVTMKHRINLNVTQLDNRNYGTTWERIYSAWSCLEYQTIKLARIECLHHRLP